MITAILDNKINESEYVKDSVFGLAIPKKIDGIPTEILNPREMWADKSKYDLDASNLADLFKKNFDEYGASVAHLKEYGPNLNNKVL